MNIYFVLLIQMMVAGGTHIVAKAVVGHVDAAALTFLRSLFSTAGMIALLAIRGKKIRVERRDWGMLFLIGFLAIPLNQYLYLYGMKSSTAANGALLYASTPVLVLLLSAFLTKERVTPRKAIGILLAFLGITIVIFERGVEFSSEYTVGNAIIMVAVVAWALFTTTGKPLILKYGALQTTAISGICGAVLFAPFGIASTMSLSMSELSVFDWAGVAYLGLGTSVVGYVLWYYALGRIETSKVAVFANGQPVFATILSLIFFDYGITGSFLIGGSITIAGVVITQFS